LFFHRRGGEKKRKTESRTQTEALTILTPFFNLLWRQDDHHDKERKRGKKKGEKKTGEKRKLNSLGHTHIYQEKKKKISKKVGGDGWFEIHIPLSSSSAPQPDISLAEGKGRKREKENKIFREALKGGKKKGQGWRLAVHYTSLVSSYNCPRGGKGGEREEKRKIVYICQIEGLLGR